MRNTPAQTWGGGVGGGELGGALKGSLIHLNAQKLAHRQGMLRPPTVDRVIIERVRPCLL